MRDVRNLKRPVIMTAPRALACLLLAPLLLDGCADVWGFGDLQELDAGGEGGALGDDGSADSSAGDFDAGDGRDDAHGADSASGVDSDSAAILDASADAADSAVCVALPPSSYSCDSNGNTARIQKPSEFCSVTPGTAFAYALNVPPQCQCAGMYSCACLMAAQIQLCMTGSFLSCDDTVGLIVRCQ